MKSVRGAHKHRETCGKRQLSCVSQDTEPPDSITISRKGKRVLEPNRRVRFTRGAGEVQAREGATVYVRELDLIVTVMLLENTPVVLSLGKLCEEFGSGCHWTSGQKPTTSHQKWQENPLQHIKLCTIRCPILHLHL